jgi:transcriptional regulator with XRE-family HTH domain
VASPRRNASSGALTAGQPGLDGSSRGLISGALFKVTRESADLTQQDLADALALDKSTVQAWEAGRRPLTSARTGTVVSLRFALLDLGADPQLVDSLDTAAEADHLLDRLLDDDAGRHPFASRVLPQPLSDLLAWPLNPNPPRVVASAYRPARRGPVVSGPMLAAGDRRRLLANLRTAAEHPSAPADRVSQVRRQVAYLASFDRAPDTAGWLAALRSAVAHADPRSRFSPGWAEARSIAVALGRQGDADALNRFVQIGRQDDTWETANLNYWAYWAGETRGIERDDTFMGAKLGRWRGQTLLDHLTARLGPNADDLTLNVHTVWALIVARRGILEDDPVLARSLADRITLLLDSDSLPATRRSEAESIRSALTMAGVRT